VCGPLHVFELPALDRPQENNSNDGDEDQAEWNQQIKNVHSLTFLSCRIVFVTQVKEIIKIAYDLTHSIFTYT
jgi:hypothetical protein